MLRGRVTMSWCISRPSFPWFEDQRNREAEPIPGISLEHPLKRCSPEPRDYRPAGAVFEPSLTNYELTLLQELGVVEHLGIPG